jgi:hypothetical protein
MSPTRASSPTTAIFHDFDGHGTYLADDMRVDEDGNPWCAGGWVRQI